MKKFLVFFSLVFVVIPVVAFAHAARPSAPCTEIPAHKDAKNLTGEEIFQHVTQSDQEHTNLVSEIYRLKHQEKTASTKLRIIRLECAANVKKTETKEWLKISDWAQHTMMRLLPEDVRSYEARKEEFLRAVFYTELLKQGWHFVKFRPNNTPYISDMRGYVALAHKIKKEVENKYEK